MGPKMGSRASEAGLDLITNQQTTRLAHDICDGFKPPIRVVGKAFVQEIGADNNGGETWSVFFQRRNLGRDGGRK